MKNAGFLAAKKDIFDQVGSIAILEKIHGKIRPLAPSPYQRWESDPFWLSGGFILDFFGGGRGGGWLMGVC